MLRLLIITLSLFIFHPSLTALAAENGRIDVVIVLDSSGSMKKTDPNTLRIPAAKLFTTLLTNNDRVGIISFSTEATPLHQLVSIEDEDSKGKTLGAIEKVTSDGRYTNIYEALLKGQLLLDSKDDLEAPKVELKPETTETKADDVNIDTKDKSEAKEVKEPEKVNAAKETEKTDSPRASREQFIILMSDGKMDVGSREKDVELTSMLREELLPQLAKKNIKVYTIAFTKESDTELLREISNKTEGLFNFVMDDGDIHKAFSTIFESLKSPDMLPIQDGNKILIDSSVTELTVIATKDDPETDVELKKPDGTKIAASGENVRWFSSQKFDMVTITRPEIGTWEILYSTGEFNKAYIITNLSLKSNIKKEEVIAGERKQVDFWFERNGQLMTEKEVLDTLIVTLELNGPENLPQDVSLSRKVGKDAALVRGVYNVSFTPEKTGRYQLTFNVKCETFERAKTYVFDVQAKAGGPVTTGTKVVEVPMEEKIDWPKVMTRFAAINLALIIIVFAYIKIQKRRIKADA